MEGKGLLEELDLSAEEAERLQRAFRDEKFRALFAEYAAELTDPEQRRLYEEEVTALERERGVQVRFVHPTAGYVLRTSLAGDRRCYLNVCSNPHVGPPQPRAEPGGYRWELPYCLAPGRDELGRGGVRRTVYDVMFHPSALRLAARSHRFRSLLSNTALEAVEQHCSVQLDRANAAVLRRIKYKGIPQPPVLRSPLPRAAPPLPTDESPLPPFPFPPASIPAPSPLPPPSSSSSSLLAGPATPRWSIRHRSYVEWQDYRCCRDSAPSPVPQELVVTVELPLLRSAAQAQLEIRGRELLFDSLRPAYRLRLCLPYSVDESRGRAAFDKARRQLQVTLPVLPVPTDPPGPQEAEESSDAVPPPSPSPEPCSSPEPASPSPPEVALPQGTEVAMRPPFQCWQDEASVTLLLQVPAVQPHSLRGDVGMNHYSLQFSTDTDAYALFLQFLPENRLAFPETSISVLSHNTAIGLAKAPGSTGLWEKFHFGLNASALQERLFVSEENVDGFLGTVLCPSFCSQSAQESWPSIEALDASEDRIQIRLKPEEPACCELDRGEEMYSSSGDATEKPNGDDSQVQAETDCPAADTANREHPAETSTTSTSLTAETMGEVGCNSQRCLQHETPDTSSAIPGESRREEPELEKAVPRGDGATGFVPEGQAGGEGVAVAAPTVLAQETERSLENRPASPVLREVNLRDGSEQVIRDHVTRCPIELQNILLFELD